MSAYLQAPAQTPRSRSEACPTLGVELCVIGSTLRAMPGTFARRSSPSSVASQTDCIPRIRDVGGEGPSARSVPVGICIGVPHRAVRVREPVCSAPSVVAGALRDVDADALRVGHRHSPSAAWVRTSFGNSPLKSPTMETSPRWGRKLSFSVGSTTVIRSMPRFWGGAEHSRHGTTTRPPPIRRVGQLQRRPRSEARLPPGSFGGQQPLR